MKIIVVNEDADEFDPKDDPDTAELLDALEEAARNVVGARIRGLTVRVSKTL